MTQTQKCAGCPSCNAGLYHYDADRPVSVADQAKSRLLWGDVLELASTVGGAVGKRIWEALNRAAEFVYAGVTFRSGRCDKVAA